jgi:ribosomal-protein-alanine N-acetyltransferase
MSKGGRFGKYGETKRIARLRQARQAGDRTIKKGGDYPRRRDPQKGRVILKKAIILRQAEETDKDYIRTLSGKAFRRYGPYEELLPLWFETGIAVTILAMVGKRPAGFAMLGIPSGEWQEGLAGELLAIAVEPSMQRAGIGDLLMREAVRRAKMLNMEVLILHTAPDNLPAKRLFRKHGFLPSEIKRSFYPEGQDALMMVRDFLT